MTIDTENLLNSIMDSIDRISHIKSEDIPNIDLYMDQVTTFMDKKLKNTSRNPGEDKVLTKTMINNYAKNDLLPPPIKKKYSKDHVLELIFIYYFKGILSISDIQVLLKPISERFFGTDSELSLQAVYDGVFALEKAQVDDLKKDILDKYLQSETAFTDAPEEDKEFLQLFSFICMLSFDVYVKKLLIEKLIDGLLVDGKQGQSAKQVDKRALDKAAAEKRNAEKQNRQPK
ncbi:MAG: DUF1836 domain-containing protein [Clostridiales bacterium]|nr:DUF1836 domain-containing protein [Clostridiales bacterium]